MRNPDETDSISGGIYHTNFYYTYANTRVMLVNKSKSIVVN